MNITKDISPFFEHGPLQYVSFGLFVMMIPLLTIILLFGVRKAATRRMHAARVTFPKLTPSKYYKQFSESYRRTHFWSYVMPVTMIFLVNMLMAAILFNLFNLKDGLVDDGYYYILCGPDCTLPQDKDNTVRIYQTVTLVAASYAFLGWMIWTLTTIFDRANLLQLLPSTLNRLIIRLVAAVIVAVVVRHTVMVDIATSHIPLLAVAFAVGMVPQRGIAFITSKVGALFRPSVRASEDFPLELIQGISGDLVFRIQELGIYNAVDLSHANPFALFDATGYSLSEIVDWIAQSQLLVMTQSAGFEALQAAGYRTLFDVVRLLKQTNGADALKAACKLEDPTKPSVGEGLRLDQIESQAEYIRLREIYEALGSLGP